MRVLVTGSISYDFIMDFPGRFADRIMADKIHQISLSFLVDTLDKQFGGIGVNIGYTLKLLGIDPTILATGGKDFGPYKTFLRRHKISTNSITIHKDTNTSSYFVVTDKEDNQIGSFYIGAQKYASKLSIAQYADSGNRPNLVVIAPTDPKAMKKFVRECNDSNLPYVYHPAFQIATFSKEELQAGVAGATVVIGNDYEVALMENRMDMSHDELVATVPVVITTLGSKGSMIETRSESIHIKPAKPKAVVDPTGAGDAYCAGFIAGYLRGFDLSICGQMGSVAAVYAVEKYGTLPHPFTKKQFVKRYSENFGKPLPL